MDLRAVTVKLPEPLIAAALRMAGERDVSLGQVIRAALAGEIQRAGRNVTPPNRAEEQLLAADFVEARSWQELDQRLKDKGYALREAGGGLALHSHPQGARMCKASELGHAYSTLMRRFAAPFPHHRHRHLADKLLGPTWQEEEDFDVIERSARPTRAVTPFSAPVFPAFRRSAPRSAPRPCADCR